MALQETRPTADPGLYRKVLLGMWAKPTHNRFLSPGIRGATGTRAVFVGARLGLASICKLVGTCR